MSSGSLGDLLRAAEFADGISANCLEMLARRARWLGARSGQFIVIAGQQVEHLHLVAEGTVRLSFPNVSGNEKTIATLGSGKMFGLAEIFSGLPYRYQVESVGSSRLVTIPGAALQAAGEQNVRLYRNMLVAMGRHFDALAHDIEYSARFTAFQRVVNYLLGSGEKLPDGRIIVQFPTSKGVAASRLGVTPETFSRSLATLTAAGLVRADRNKVELLDITGLQDLLEPVASRS